MPGGYHRCFPGEVYKDRYRIECKLGWGHFSTVWLATDFFPPTPRYVAVKFQKSARQFVEAARDEIHILETVNQTYATQAGKRVQQYHQHLFPEIGVPRRGVVEFLDHFTHNGPNGMHVCMVFEVMGPNLLTLMKEFKFQGISIDMVRKIAAHTLLGLDFLHRACGVIHTDVKPENILVSAALLPPPKPLKIDYPAAVEYGPDEMPIGVSTDKDNKAKLKKNRLKKRRKEAKNDSKSPLEELEELYEEDQNKKKKRRRRKKRLDTTSSQAEEAAEEETCNKAVDENDSPDGNLSHDLEVILVDATEYVVELGADESEVLYWKACLLTHSEYQELLTDPKKVRLARLSHADRASFVLLCWSCRCAGGDEAFVFRRTA